MLFCYNHTLFLLGQNILFLDKISLIALSFKYFSFYFLPFPTCHPSLGLFRILFGFNFASFVWYPGLDKALQGLGALTEHVTVLLKKGYFKRPAQIDSTIKLFFFPLNFLQIFALFKQILHAYL